MKKFLLISLILQAVNCTVSAQDNNEVKIVGHYRDEYFIIKEKDYYLVEQLSPLKYSSIKYDTLFPVRSTIDTFRGKIYTLLFKNDELQLVSNDKLHFANKKYREKYDLKSVYDEDIKSRIRKHNLFYYNSCEVKISQYSKLLSEKDIDEYKIFEKYRMEMYKKVEELSIEDFKNYFDAFLKKCNLE